MEVTLKGMNIPGSLLQKPWRNPGIYLVPKVVTSNHYNQGYQDRSNGVFTLPDTDTDTDKKWVIKNCVEVFIPTQMQCEHTISGNSARIR